MSGMSSAVLSGCFYYCSISMMLSLYYI